MWTKSRETTWICTTCLDSNNSQADTRRTNNRRSIGPGAAPSQDLPDDSDEVPNNSRNHNQVSLNDIMDKLLQIEAKHADLLTKYEVQVKINEELRSEIADIRRQISADNGIVNPANILNSDNEIFQEVFQRQTRINNLMVFNLGLEEDTPELVQISSLLSSKVSRPVEASSVVRVGKPNRNGHKPLKVTLTNANDVSTVLKNRRKFIDTHQVYIEADLSPAQLKQLNDTKEELRVRRANGEENLILRFTNGIPILTAKNPNPAPLQPTS